MYVPTREEFRQKATEGNLIPVYREILADMETPVSAFAKTVEGDYGFLLESVEGGENIARYSFLGSQPAMVLTVRRNEVTTLHPDTGETATRTVEDPFAELEAVMDGFRPVPVAGLPPFHGGAVGFLGYDMARNFEDIPDTTTDDAEIPDSVFMLTDTVLVFDRVLHKVKVVSNAHLADGMDVDQAYDEAVAKVEATIDRLRRPLPGLGKSTGGVGERPDPRSNMPREEFEAAVSRIREYVAAGDCIQTVFAQRFSVPLTVEPFDFYRALRTVNPSPYMYFLQLGDLKIAGASPETLARVEDRHVEVRPLAGTAPRGSTPAADVAAEEEMLADPKERAEHVMLVDLGRNDIGRVCEYGSVRPDRMMYAVRYSHVMHIESTVTGRLREDKTAFDVIRASFPAGTLSGAPKIRAMEIIDELEPTRRGPYGGAVGYFSFSGNSDTAITIRTLVMQGDTAYVQAGAGIVADSVPEKEYQESCNKARAVLKALEMAHEGLE
ncbi:anthranilate synthase component I [Candidatus Poribacteria bacterium]|nr:anthranilate synthase component I [Candidatus Poribacteria bacterium]MBT5712212.1 anthranilate synthase component I [Candidatus Poribacteria bacterium]MBT7099252.1 anthranilate synthase component I [Candidatus Poribacteria bacterium]MBT7808617.1 anthranilate synthase component I [Candidatus Poribacteria bacterium]